MEARARENIGFESELGPSGIENLAGGRDNPPNFKIFVHNQQDIEVPGGWFCRNEAAPHEYSPKLASQRSEFYQGSQSAKQPYPSRSCQTETRMELLPRR